MSKVYSVKNISNRTLELSFGEHSERIEPHTTGKPHTADEWDDSFAKKQAEEFAKRHEVRILVSEKSDVAQSTNAEARKVNDANDSNKKKGDK